MILEWGNSTARNYSQFLEKLTSDIPEAPTAASSLKQVVWNRNSEQLLWKTRTNPPFPKQVRKLHPNFIVETQLAPCEVIKRDICQVKIQKELRNRQRHLWARFNYGFNYRLAIRLSSFQQLFLNTGFKRQSWLKTKDADPEAPGWGASQEVTLSNGSGNNLLHLKHQNFSKQFLRRLQSQMFPPPQQAMCSWAQCSLKIRMFFPININSGLRAR